MTTRHLRLALATACISLLMSACAAGPEFRTEGVSDLEPRTALEAGGSAVGERVIWGGRIIDVRPLEQGTQIELLSYSLGRGHQPDPDQPSQGRFLVLHPEYLEPEDWTAGRLVTVTGTLTTPQSGRIGEADYRYPVVLADEIHLWPEQATAGSRGASPRVNFGFGVIFSR